MSGYRRFIAYVYEYQKGKKGGNCGFIKVEIRNQRCRIELHLHCAALPPQTECKVYGIVRKDGLMNGIFLGACQAVSDTVECLFETDAANMADSGVPFAKMGGIVLLTHTGGFFGTEWDDQPVRPDNFREIRPAQPSRSQSAPRRSDDTGAADSSPELSAESADISESAVSAPAIHELSISEPIISEPAAPETIISKPVATKTIISESATPEPAVSESIIPEPAASNPPEPDASSGSLPENPVYEAEAGLSPGNDSRLLKTAEQRASEAVQNEAIAPNVAETAQKLSHTAKPDTSEAAPSPAEETAPVTAEASAPSAQSEAPSPNYSRKNEPRFPRRTPASSMRTPCPGKQGVPPAEFTPFDDVEFIRCWKIHPADLNRISPQARGLRSNRFLQYGYYNFGHLLLAQRSGGRFVLGVPGGYDQQERFMAGMFGFPYFKECRHIELPGNRGGYWYRLINAPNFH